MLNISKQYILLIDTERVRVAQRNMCHRSFNRPRVVSVLNCVQTLHTCSLMLSQLAEHVGSIPRAAAARCTFNMHLHVTACL